MRPNEPPPSIARFPTCCVLLLAAWAVPSMAQNHPTLDEVKTFEFVEPMRPRSWQRDMPAVPLRDHGMLCGLVGPAAGERWPRLVAWRVPGGEVIHDVAIVLEGVPPGDVPQVIDLQRRGTRDEIVAFLTHAIVIYRMPRMEVTARIDPPPGTRFYFSGWTGPAAVDSSGERALVGLVTAWDERGPRSYAHVAVLSISERMVERRLPVVPDDPGATQLTRIEFWNSRGEIVEIRDGRIVRWDVLTGAHIATHHIEGPAMYVLVDDPPGWIHLGMEVQRFFLENDRVEKMAAAFPDGIRSFTFVHSSKRLYVGDAKRGRIQVATFPGLEIERELPGLASDRISVMRLSTDGRWLYTATHFGEWALWDAETGERLLDQPIAGRISWIQFLPVGDHFLTRGERGQIVEWDLASRRRIDPAFVTRTPGSHTGTFRPRVAFTPDGERYLATDSQGNYELRRTATREIEWSARVEDDRHETYRFIDGDGHPATLLLPFEDRRALTFTRRDQLVLLEMTDEPRIHRLDREIKGFGLIDGLFLPKESLFVLREPGHLRFVAIDPEDETLDVRQEWKGGYGRPVVSPDGSRIASIWSFSDEREIVIFSPSGELAGRIEPGWKPVSFHEIAFVAPEILAVVEFRQLPSSADLVYRVAFYDVSSGERIHSLPLPTLAPNPVDIGSPVQRMAAHPSGRALLIAGTDGVIHVCRIRER